VKSYSIPACARRSESTRAGRLEHDGDRRLVVGPEDRPAALRTMPSSSTTGSIRPVGGTVSRWRTEKDRRARRRRLDARVEIARRGADLRAGAILVDVERAVAQVCDHDVGDCALLARRAGDRRRAP
jgi:hypothetical protein